MVNVYLFGASGHGKVVKDILNANGVKVEAFVDDRVQSSSTGIYGRCVAGWAGAEDETFYHS